MPTTPRRARLLVPALLVMLSLVVVGLGPASAARRSPTTPASAPAGPAGSLSDAELVGQVLMPYVFGEHAADVTA